jgi:hydrogenase maturation factor
MFRGLGELFVDSAGALFVALRWLAEVHGVVVDLDSELVPLKQTPVGVTSSYSVLPVAVIANGALVIQANGKMWACLSPRETSE